MAEGRGDVVDQVALANRMIGLLPETDGQGIDEAAEQLMALLAEQDPALTLGRTASDAVRPETSIAQSSLFTGAVHEPQMFSELKKEIASHTGSRPMNIVWQLHQEIPAKFLKKTQQVMGWHMESANEIKAKQFLARRVCIQRYHLGLRHTAQ
jgi:hypothetical protein